MSKRSFRGILLFGAALMAAGGAGAQLLPQVGALPGQVLGGVLGPGGAGNVPVVGGAVDMLGVRRIGEGFDAPSLLDLRRQRLRALIQQNRRVLEADDEGNPVRKGEVIAIDPSAAILGSATAAGFRVLREDRIEGLGLRMVVLSPLKGQDAEDALKALRKIAPDARFELNHVFEPAGAKLMAAGAASVAQGGGGRAAIGMVDGGVANHPALGGAAIEQRGFAPRGAQASGHGTAVASLLVGNDGKFMGAARGASLLVADVYGGDAAARSADTIARALGWLAERGVRVINISLVGPPNRLLERAVAALRARGVIIVAAVGNDGPAAPPQYPASYPGVIAVTGVDARDKALTEAGKAAHLDFAAPGADMAAALPGKGYAIVRGTSFAAPLVAARLAMAGGSVERVAAEAVPGKGKVGRGIVCKPCRVEPKAVGAKRT
jgi:hypothetical protein